MELRKRVKPKHGLSQDAPSEGRCNHNALSGTQEGFLCLGDPVHVPIPVQAFHPCGLGNSAFSWQQGC